RMGFIGLHALWVALSAATIACSDIGDGSSDDPDGTPTDEGAGGAPSPAIEGAGGYRGDAPRPLAPSATSPPAQEPTEPTYPTQPGRRDDADEEAIDAGVPDSSYAASRPASTDTADTADSAE